VSAKYICFASIFTLRGYKAGLVTLAQPTSFHTISLCSSTSFPMAEKRKNRETIFWKYKEGCSWAYRESFFLPFLFHGGVGLACIGGHPVVPTKPCEYGVYDSGGVCYLSCACGPYISCSNKGVRRGVCGLL
jgi:hypothetical protein